MQETDSTGGRTCAQPDPHPASARADDAALIPLDGGDYVAAAMYGVPWANDPTSETPIVVVTHFGRVYRVFLWSREVEEVTRARS